MKENTKIILIISVFSLFSLGIAGYYGGLSEGVDKDLLRSTYSRAYFEGAETGVKLVKDTTSTIVDFRENFYADSLSFEEVIK